MTPTATDLQTLDAATAAGALYLRALGQAGGDREAVGWAERRHLDDVLGHLHVRVRTLAQSMLRNALGHEGPGRELEDAIQAAQMAIVEHIHEYDPEKAALWTWASSYSRGGCARAAIQEHIEFSLDRSGMTRAEQLLARLAHVARRGDERHPATNDVAEVRRRVLQAARERASLGLAAAWTAEGLDPQEESARAEFERQVDRRLSRDGLTAALANLPELLAWTAVRGGEEDALGMVSEAPIETESMARVLARVATIGMTREERQVARVVADGDGGRAEQSVKELMSQRMAQPHAQFAALFPGLTLQVEKTRTPGAVDVSRTAALAMA